MSNGHVCCAVGICCPPPANIRKQTRALAEILSNGGEPDMSPQAAPPVPPSPEHLRYAELVLAHFDLAPAGTLAPFIESLRPYFSQSQKKS